MTLVLYLSLLRFCIVPLADKLLYIVIMVSAINPAYVLIILFGSRFWVCNCHQVEIRVHGSLFNMSLSLLWCQSEWAQLKKNKYLSALILGLLGQWIPIYPVRFKVLALRPLCPVFYGGCAWAVVRKKIQCIKVVELAIQRWPGQHSHPFLFGILTDRTNLC